MQKELSHIKFAGSSIRGYSLAEILVAVSVFLIFIYSLSLIIFNTERQLKHSSNTEKALFLAEEGLEAVRNIRDSGFSSVSLGTFGLSTSSNQWNLGGANDTDGFFTRNLNITNVSANQVRVDSQVSWVDQASSNNSVVLSTYITNWRAFTASQATNLIVGTSTAYIRSSDRKYIRGITLDNISNSTSTIVAMTVSWTKPNRLLNQINSPYGSVVWGPSATSSGATVNLSSPIVLGPNSAGRQVELIFSNSMTGGPFNLSITFIMADSSSNTSLTVNPPIGTP